MKFPIVLLSAVFSISSWAASSLDIAAGETYTVTPQQQRLTLDSLTVGDGARIVFANGVEHWQVRANSAQIGANVLIDANGKAGTAGAAGAGFSAAAKPCTDGESGEPGSNGGDGSAGVSVRLQLGLVSLGSLRINSQGGAGGAGGNGGAGQTAGEFSKTCKNAPDGGAAGNGGNGGNGGNAGDVTVLYWPADNRLALNNVPNLISVDTAAGAAGTAGEAGKPGAGSEGRYVQKKTLTGSRAWVGGGDTGASAQAGSAGREGLSGRVLVEQALVNAAPAAVASPKPAATTGKAANKDEEIKAIKESLKALIERLDQLEQE